MKKLISAASALAMAASMVGAAVPFATGAADASKSLELRLYDKPDGTAASATISAADIAAGDVKVPIGVYIVEDTPDSAAITANWAISSKDGDASNKYVTFTPWVPKKEYYTVNRTVTDAKGDTFETNIIISFAGTLKVSRGKVTYSELGSAERNVADCQNSLNIDTAWGSVVYTKPVSDPYSWTGPKSDSFPMYVFEVNFAKGTPAGTYDINFLDFVPEEKYPEIWTTMIEGAQKYVPENGNLKLKGVSIKIEGEGGGNTQTPTDPPAQTPTDPPAQQPTEGGSQGGNQGGSGSIEVMPDFKIIGQEVEAKAGETVQVVFKVQSGGHKAATLVAEPAAMSGGLKAALSDTDTGCYAFDDAPEWTLTGETYYCHCKDPDNSDPRPFMDGEDVIVFDVTVPAGTKDGTYTLDFSRFQVVEDAGQKNPKIEFLAAVTPAKIVVGNGGDVTTPTDPPATPTDAPKPTDPPATPTDPPVTGNAVYGDTNCDGKVNIADVVVLNKWLNDNSSYAITDQGKLNADCCDAKGGAGLDKNDSDAIIKSIVHLVELPCTSAQLK